MNSSDVDLKGEGENTTQNSNEDDNIQGNNDLK